MFINMRALGIFEIKTKLSQVCEDVARTGESVLITKRGKPFVRIDPLKSFPSNMSSVWDIRDAYLSGQEITDDLVLPKRQLDDIFNPFEEESR